VTTKVEGFDRLRSSHRFPEGAAGDTATGCSGSSARRRGTWSRDTYREGRGTGANTRAVRRDAAPRLRTICAVYRIATNAPCLTRYLGRALRGTPPLRRGLVRPLKHTRSGLFRSSRETSPALHPLPNRCCDEGDPAGKPLIDPPAAALAFAAALQALSARQRGAL